MMQNTPYGIVKPNWVAWFMETIRSFGGEYIPMRDLEEKKPVTGRRVKLPMYEITREVNGVRRYGYDRHGSVRRMFFK